MNVLLLGSGGREHALAWKLAQSPALTKLFAAPGNPGIGHHAALVPLALSDAVAIVDFARQAAIDLVVVGPEQPLVDGLGDALRAAGIAVFGPSAAAARLEGSKGFTKALCDRAGVPTAGYGAFTDAAEAKATLPRFGDPECEVLMMRLDEDLLPLLRDAANGKLQERPVRWRDDAALTVVMAANGYPGTPQAGGAIRGLEAVKAAGTQVFHAGTRYDADGLVAAGGRVLAVTALGNDVRAARDATYRAVDMIDFATGFCRRDIGWREVAREALTRQSPSRN